MTAGETLIASKSTTRVHLSGVQARVTHLLEELAFPRYSVSLSPSTPSPTRIYISFPTWLQKTSFLFHRDASLLPLLAAKWSKEVETRIFRPSPRPGWVRPRPGRLTPRRAEGGTDPSGRRLLHFWAGFLGVRQALFLLAWVPSESECESLLKSPN